MSVANTTFRMGFVAEVSPQNFGYPTQRWYARGQVTGDATGDDAAITLDLPSNRVVSLEAVGAFRSDGTAADARLQWFPQAPIGEGSAYEMNAALELVALASTGAAVRARDLYVGPAAPISMGRGLSAPAIPNGRVTLTMENVNLTVYQLHAWGYVWDQRVLVVPGGPIRPGQFPI